MFLFNSFRTIPKFWENCYTTKQQIDFLYREFENLDTRVDELENNVNKKDVNMNEKTLDKIKADIL